MNAGQPEGLVAVLGGTLTGLAVLSWPGRRSLVGSSRAATVATDGGLLESPHPMPPDAALLDILQLVSAQVRAGSAPVLAWDASLEVLGLSRRGLAGAPQAWLDRAGRTAEPARAAAAAWRLAERTGAPLADTLDGVAAALREEQELAAEVAAALAGPRATVRLLTVLPLGGLLLGELIGAHPGRVLVATGVGRGCAGLGIALLLLGRWWMRRMVRAVGRMA